MKIRFFALVSALLLVTSCQLKNENRSVTLDDQTTPNNPGQGPANGIPGQQNLDPIDQRFSPTGNVRDGVSGVLAKATKSVDVAIYSLGDKQIITTLSDLGKSGVKVRLILNKPTGKCKLPKPGDPKANNFCDQLEDSGIDVRYVTPVMHHKFGIIDGGQSGSYDNVKVMTGSANWSFTAFAVYDEDWVAYEGDSALARDFQREFNYIWDHAKDYPGATVADPSIPVPSGVSDLAFFTSANTSRNSQKGSFKWNKTGTAVSSRVVAELDKAVSSIKIAHAHFRNEDVFKAVKRAHERGVNVRIVLDQQEYRPGSEFSNDKLFFEELLAKDNVDVRYKVYSVKWNHTSAKQMHSKFAVIDDKVVLTGSYNWSENAENNTFENMVVITSDAVVQKYVDQFEIVANYRAGEFDGLIAKLKQGHTAVDCNLSVPMTMTAKQLDDWRDIFPPTLCK